MDQHSEVISTHLRNFSIKATGCDAYSSPSIPEYLTALDLYGTIIFSVGGVAVLIIIMSFIDTLIFTIKHAPQKVKAHTAFILAVYPAVSVAGYISNVVPRAQLVLEAFIQIVFTTGMYQFFCLSVAYCGGETELAKKVKPNLLNFRIGPCCCRLCLCLPKVDLSKNKVKLLRLFVLQMPIVQTLVYVILLILYSEKINLYVDNYLYFQPLITASVFVELWGMFMAMKLLRELLSEYSIGAKFASLQTILFFAKFQAQLIRGVGWIGIIPCKPPISAKIFANIIQNSLFVFEILLLSLLARMLYKRKIPEFVEHNNNIEEVFRSSHVTTIEGIMTGEMPNQPVTSQPIYNYRF